MITEAPRKKSPRKAIAAHCRWCIYDPKAPGSCLQQIMDCTVKTCELFEYRPHRKPKPNKNDLPIHSPASTLNDQEGGS